MNNESPTRTECEAAPDGTADPVSENFRKLPIPAERSSPEEDENPVGGVTAQQLVAIELLAIGKALGTVAKAVEVTPRTLYNWRQDDLFREQLARRQRELWHTASRRLRALVHPSLDIVEKQLRDPFDKSRFRAATAVLRLSDLRKVEPADEPE
jgi:hypothetical protein